MRDLAAQLADIKAKAEELVKRQQLLDKENEKLIAENNKLKEELENGKHQLRQLEEKSKVTGLAKALDKGEKKEVKLKINELVREVDKCIAQLNR